MCLCVCFPSQNNNKINQGKKTTTTWSPVTVNWEEPLVWHINEVWLVWEREFLPLWRAAPCIHLLQTKTLPRHPHFIWCRDPEPSFSQHSWGCAGANGLLWKPGGQREGGDTNLSDCACPSRSPLCLWGFQISRFPRTNPPPWFPKELHNSFVKWSYKFQQGWSWELAIIFWGGSLYNDSFQHKGVFRNHSGLDHQLVMLCSGRC